jgi:peptidoglycan/LPS O-acetylase OafA/YrhL
MSIFNIGPDGLIVLEALIVPLLIAVLAWRRVGLTSAAIVTVIAAISLVVWQETTSATKPGHQLIVASFTVVPSALLLGASRLRWIARHAWVLLVAGPIVFIGCFVGICELCARAGLLS